MDALLITRLKTKPGQTKRDYVNLSDLIVEVLNEEKEKLLSANLKVKRNNEMNFDLVPGEAALLKKCIGNVLDNAIRFSPEAGVIAVSYTHLTLPTIYSV